VETPRKFITAVINLRGISTNKTIICFIAMQTYKEIVLLYIVLNRYSLLIIAGSFADNCMNYRFSARCVIARFNCKLLSAWKIFNNHQYNYT
jgi:hypothetical protein